MLSQDIIERLISELRPGKSVMLSGLDGSAKSFLLYLLVNRYQGKLACLVPGEEDALDLARELRGFLGLERVWIFLARDLVFMGEKGTRSYAGVNRLLTLNELITNPQRAGVIVVSAGSLLSKIVSPRVFKEEAIRLTTGQEADLDDVMRRLVKLGYERCPVVREPGYFSARGGILDVYPTGREEPLRIDFFGDEIEAIYKFDSRSQRSVNKVKSLTVSWADEIAVPLAEAHFLDYLAPEVPIFLDEPRKFISVLEKQGRRYRDYLQSAQEQELVVEAPEQVSWDETDRLIRQRPLIYHSFFPGSLENVAVEFYQHISQKEMETFFVHPEVVSRRIREWVAGGYVVNIAVQDQKSERKIREELDITGLPGVDFSRWDLDQGFISPTLRVAVISDRDLWGKRMTSSGPRRRRKQEPSGLALEELKVGDYVVHESCGIGLFQGITKMEAGGVTQEYLLIQYAGTDRVYLPVDRLDLLTRYHGPEDKEPRLHKLGGTQWEKTRQKVQESVREMAQGLLRIYAVRQSAPGIAFSPDTIWQQEFEEAFEYEETPDQLQAVAEVKKDMETPRPMDRLICGDVGYGKTEVALRAAFKAIMDHKQVAVLVPTTILAEQHYQTCRERFEDYPIIVEVLSRFRTAAEQKQIIHDLSRGVVDMVIGTHRLLSRDIRFKDLGLLIVDEEHRFGVKQKEKIKAWKETVDVLSLSATPIPRTLHMALTGLRDLSVIETPPVGRYPITSYVMEYNEEIIREAVMTEVERGGQVFVVHNRIEDIEALCSELEAILPGIEMEVAHGRMPEKQLADVMKRFIEQEFQVLVCTTIIESGLDLPNVNTMIVDEADRLGLAQLYQLRGRIGRSRRMAYAYLTYRPHRALNETAQKRLNAIREFTELGSGMKIALRDLEIRGAGNILGAEQHGHIAAVGFDLYCRLLEEETARLKGEVKQEAAQPTVNVKIDTFIPDEYIPDAGTRLQIYRRAMLAVEGQELEDIQAELQDRFGPIPHPVKNLLRVSRLRVVAREKDIESISSTRKGMEILLHRALDGGADRLRRLSRENNLPIRINNRTIAITFKQSPDLNILEQVLNAI
jgi:transcription-repair coupling factor (superfamily II helicase)